MPFRFLIRMLGVCVAALLCGLAALPSKAGDLVVAGWSSSNVVRYDALTGEVIEQIVTSRQGNLLRGHSVQLGPDGHLYVSSTGNSSVMRYHGETGENMPGPDGAQGTAEFVPSGSGGLSGPTNALFGPDGNLYVSSLNNSRVIRYDGQTGAFIDTFVPTGSGGLSGGESLTFGPDGHLYVCSSSNSAIMRYDGRTGDPLPGPFGADGTAQFVTPRSGGLSGPHTAIFGPDGHLYADSFNNNRVIRYDGETGAPLAVVVTPGNGLSSPHGIAFGPDGNLYVGSFGTSQVLRYDPSNGAFLGVFAEGGGLVATGALLFRCIAGDCDCDDRITLDDFECFYDCLGGPDAPSTTGCETFDFDGGGTIDLADYAELQRLFDAD